MSDVLLMSAPKLSNPILIFIQMKTNNFPQLTLRLSLQLHDLLPDWNPEELSRSYARRCAVNELTIDPLKGRRCLPTDLFKRGTECHHRERDSPPRGGIPRSYAQ